MAAWSMARRLGELCANGASRQAAPSTCLPVRGGFHFAPPKLSQHLKRSLSSSVYSLAASSPRSTGFPRPEEIDYDRNLTNTVHLIGRVKDTVSIKYLDSGKIVANTRLRVAQDNPRHLGEFSLQFWDELAEVAAAHLKQEDYVYVSGPIWVENFMTKESDQGSTCKVVCRHLKFVSGIVRSSNESTTSVAEWEPKGEQPFCEDLWQKYFENPSAFWDNRANKRSSRSPDLKHKATGACLWLSSLTTPAWVHEKLGQQHEMVSKQGKDIDKQWEDLFADPSGWWDNRKLKKSPISPDFRSKTTGFVLWLDRSNTPAWVTSQLPQLDSKMKSSSYKSADQAGELQKASVSRFEDEGLMLY